jgi:hypothetical protein
MAITAFTLGLISRVAAKLERPCRMLSLGYPDMLVTEKQLAEAFGGEEPLKHLHWRDDSEGILKWHGLDGDLARIAETRSVLAMIGVRCDFVDIVASRGMETIVDLNHPAPADMLGKYDIVFDGGTLEHCFNVGQVMRNILGFTKVGGYVIHVNPFNMYNHGFFNFNPTFYYDWYARSGNQIVTPFYGIHGPILEQRVAPLEPLATFTWNGKETAVAVVARRLVPGEPAWPTQSKYVENPALRRE